MTAAGGEDSDELAVRYRGLPRTVTAEIMRLQRQHGGVTNEILVKEAEAPENPLHQRFLWDDDLAGHKYRLQQASALLRQFQIGWEIVGGPVETRTPRLVSVVEPAGRRMRVPIEQVLGDEARLRAALADTRRQIAGLVNRIAAFRASAGVVDSLTAALEALDAALRKRD